MGPDTSLSPRLLAVLSARPARVPSPTRPGRGDSRDQHPTPRRAPAHHRGRHPPRGPCRPRQRPARPPAGHPPDPHHPGRLPAAAGLGPRAGRARGLGVEGTGCYGAALARFLTVNGQVVVEVNRPDRQARRLKGKSDPLDAQAAARAVQAGQARVVPKAGDGQVEMIRCLRVARATAMRARTQTTNTLKGLLVTAPAELPQQLPGRTATRLVQTAAALEPGPITNPLAATFALGSLARRHQALSAEIDALSSQLDRLTQTAAPELVARFGGGHDTPGALLVAGGLQPLPRP